MASSSAEKEYLLEICVDNINSAINAEDGGADRIELCSAIELGGLTPSAGLVEIVKQNLSIPVFMMIRPRPGNFEYSENEIKQMIEDIHTGLRREVDGFVFGALRNGKVDRKTCERLLEETGGLPTTFHRAFDVIRDEQALYDISYMGFSRILTSGRSPTAYEGRSYLRELVKKAGISIIIMPGSGIKPENIKRMARYTKAVEFHASGLEHRELSEEIEDPIVKGTFFTPLTSFKVVKQLKKTLAQL